MHFLQEPFKTKIDNRRYEQGKAYWPKYDFIDL